MPVVTNPKTRQSFDISAQDLPTWLKAGYVAQGAAQPAPKAEAPAQPPKSSQPQPSAAQTAIEHFGQGASRNSDELAGKAREKLGHVADLAYMAAHPGAKVPSTGAQDYAAGRDASRADLAAGAKAHPALAIGSELLGAGVGGTAAMGAGVPGAMAYGASQGVGGAPGLDKEALKAGGKEALIDGGIAALTPGGGAASVIGKLGPGIWMKRLGLTPGKMGFETLSEAKEALGQLFAKNPGLLKSSNVEEILAAAKGVRKDAGAAMDAAYSARQGAPTATRAQLYAEIEKALEHMPQVQQKFMANVARSADKPRFVEGLQAAQKHYGYAPADAEQFATDLLKGDHTPMDAHEVQSWLNELGKVAKPQGQAAQAMEAEAAGQVKAAKLAHENATGQFNATLDPASLEARKAYGPAADMQKWASSAAKKESPGSVIPKGTTFLQKGENLLHSGEAHVMGAAQRALQNPSVMAGATGTATALAGPNSPATKTFADMAQRLGVLDIPDSTARAARDLLLQERHPDYAEARKDAAKEHDEVKQAEEQSRDKAK